MPKMCGEKPCNDCPFRKSSIPGWLADYSIEDFVNYYQNDFPFPCHKTMPNEDLSPFAIEPMIQLGELKLCRGYMEMLKKSCKMPRTKWLQEILQTIEISNDSLNIQEFIEHHKKFEK